MDKETEWTCDANDAVKISLVQPTEDDQKLTTISTFFPQFTYSIFNDEETIFGYRNLNIQLRFAEHDLQSHLSITYDEKFKQVEDITAVDIPKVLKPYLPEASFSPFDDFLAQINKDEDAANFIPPGKRVHAYSRDGRDYEIWSGNLADPEVRKILDRVQILVSFFIEAGTPIETDDFDWTLERWIIYFVYEKYEKPANPKASRYSFAGYATTYRWYFYNPKLSNEAKLGVEESERDAFDSLSLSKVPARLRIAQFLIIKPHQQAGHGSQLYRTIHKACLDDPTILELTIEDPNESFDALRDSNDYHTMKPEFIKHNITINPDPLPSTTSTLSSKPRKHPRVMPTSLLVPTNTLEELRYQFKIAPTQFSHLVEMFLLSQIPATHRGAENVNMTRMTIQKSRMDNEHDRRYYWWRMLVKQRLYKRHRDMLAQIDKDERVAKLEETLQNVEEGYEVLLKAFDERAPQRSAGKMRVNEVDVDRMDVDEEATDKGVKNNAVESKKTEVEKANKDKRAKESPGDKAARKERKRDKKKEKEPSKEQVKKPEPLEIQNDDGPSVKNRVKRKYVVDDDDEDEEEEEPPSMKDSSAKRQAKKAHAMEDKRDKEEEQRRKKNGKKAKI